MHITTLSPITSALSLIDIDAHEITIRRQDMIVLSLTFPESQLPDLYELAAKCKWTVRTWRPLRITKEYGADWLRASITLPH